jgi:hypothetical protein
MRGRRQRVGPQTKVRSHVRANIVGAYVLAALGALAGIYAIFREKWYYAVILWVLAVIPLAYARSKGPVKIETPLFKYEGTLAEEEVVLRYEGEVADDEEEA